MHRPARIALNRHVLVPCGKSGDDLGSRPTADAACFEYRGELP
jgi:hypothetical protein